jgi:hypothetical protein
LRHCRIGKDHQLSNDGMNLKVLLAYHRFRLGCAIEFEFELSTCGVGCWVEE